MFDSSDRNRSFADQLADSMSADPVRRSASGTTMADSFAQGFANSLTGNDPASDRLLFGQGSFADQTTQDLIDESFGFEQERRER